MCIELEATVSRVATALRYLWPSAVVYASQEAYDTYRVTLTTRHNGRSLCTSHMLDARTLQDPGYWKHIVKELPVCHAKELALLAVAQAEAERYTSTKSTSLRGAYDDGSYSRP